MYKYAGYRKLTNETCLSDTAISLCVTALWMWLLLTTLNACGSSMTVTMRSTKPEPPELVPAPQFKEFIYKKILLLPPENKVNFMDVEFDVIKQKAARYYTAKIERTLIKHGFQIISPEIVARVERNMKASVGRASAAERAMVMGKKTKADAVLIIQSIAVKGKNIHFGLIKEAIREIEPGMVRVDEDDGRPYHAQTEQCLFRVPYYEIRLEAKLVDSGSGNVLWVGAGKLTSSDVLNADWAGQIDDDCQLIQQNFVYRDYLQNEETLDKVVTDLLGHMLIPFKNDAFMGKEIAVEKKKVEAPPPPQTEPPKEPEKKFALVSSRRASLRAHPSRRGNRMMYIPRKTKVEVTEVMGEWLKVKIQDGSIGWMHESTVILAE